MNIAGINAQVLYSFSKQDNAPKRRRIFLKKMLMSLMKEHLISRSNIKILPMDVSVKKKKNTKWKVQEFLKKRGDYLLCTIEKRDHLLQ